MTFDPVKLRKNAFSEGMLNFLLETEYNAARPMGNVAASELNVVISAWLVGLEPEVSRVLSRCLDWLDRAIAADEKFGANQDLHRRNLHWAKAIAYWMETGSDAVEWESARVFEEAAWRYEKRPWPTNEIVRDGLDDYMAFAYQTGDESSLDGYEHGIEMYERWVDSQPPQLSKVLKPREYAYALCLYHARPDIAHQYSYDTASLFTAGRRMLRGNLESRWFGAGQYIRGATWLKIVHRCGDQLLSPLDTIRKAYDDMPNVKS
ncbi:hypothetical protein [Paraburkholderia steynii]|nr:hypothetical protein [Paraburkholderia steynii]